MTNVGAIKFKRNKETGVVEAFVDGKKVGEVNTMGDDVTAEQSVQQPTT